MNQQQRDLYEATLDSLTRHPEQWSRDAVTVVHGATGVSVWIANKHYGLSIGVDDRYGCVLGGVTGWSSFFGPLIPWRRKLRAAALAVEDPEATALAGKVGAAIQGLAA